MRIGIIDFGTNTLRLSIFETEEKNFNIIYDNAIYSRVVENTSGGSLSQEGIERIIEAVEEHQLACRHFRCDRTECFSTASLRYIDNAAEVLEQVEFRTGIKIRMLCGTEEAECDFLALSSVCPAESGTGCDLGGGSLQVFTFGGGKPEKSASFPLGSSRVAKAHVSGNIPTGSETAAIFDEVFLSLKKEDFRPLGETLYAMGGTAKNLKKLNEKVFPDNSEITLAKLKTMLDVISAQPEEALELFSDISTERAKTLAPGIAVLAGLMDYMGCEKIEIFSVGVREGFLMKILNEPPENGKDVLSYILENI